MLRFARSLAVLLVLVLFSIPVAEAQIEITESDARGFVGERVALQVYTATSPSSFSSFFDQDGENLTFDFTPYNYQILFSGFQEAWEAQNAPSDVPFLTHFTDRGANVVVETRFEAEHSEEADSSSWQFFEITSSQEALHGFGAVYNQDLDQDGEQPDSVRAQWSPARIAATLPLTYEDTWEQKTDLSFSAAFPTLSSDRENEITGWGTLETPFGSAAALKRREQTADTTSIAGSTNIMRSTTLTFSTKGGQLGASITRNDDTQQITNAEINVRATEGQTFQVSQGETSTLAGPGAQVAFTQGSSSNGSIGISRFDTRPFNNTFTGSATSDDGTSVTPNVVWKERYFVVQNQGLQNFSADVCIDISSTPGVNDEGKLVVLTREAADESWSPSGSNLDGNQLCTTVSSFSQFAVGSNSSTNPLPVELAGFEGTATEDGVRLTWQTVSEDNSAGFEVQRKAGEASSWTEVDFVESHSASGTTSEPQSYQFEDTNLPYAADALEYRLKQVDLDGSTDLSRVVEIGLGVPDQLALHAPFPNPSRDHATVRYELPEATEVQIAVYDLLGRRVATPVDGRKNVGRAQVQLRTQDLPSGTYILRLQAADQTRTQRLTVVK